MATDLNPDRLAELEREQAFLLRSLDDLDAERGAGDLDAGDHGELVDDYTRRLAEVTRSIEQRRVAFAEVDTRMSARQRWLTLVAVVVVAGLAGVLLARASGFRSPTDSLSGDIRQSSAGLLAEADTLTREGRWEEALGVYDEVLDIAPSNVEAWTYRGWLHSRLGEPDRAVSDLGEAVAIDPAYPDARVFRAIVFDGLQRFDDAAAELDMLDTLEASPQISGLVDGSGLRASVAAGQIAERFAERGVPVDLTQVSGTPTTIATAGVVLLDLDPELALRVFTAVLDENPDNLTALVAAGNIQTNPAVAAASPETASRGLALLDRALELAPGDDQIRLSRAFARQSLGDRDGASADMAEIDPTGLPEPLRAAFDELAAELS